MFETTEITNGAIFLAVTSALLGGVISWLCCRAYLNWKYRNVIGKVGQRSIEAFLKFINEHLEYIDALDQAMTHLAKANEQLSQVSAKVQDVRERISSTTIEQEALSPLMQIPPRLKGRDEFHPPQTSTTQKS